MTIPLPALAERKNPALYTVNIANPLALPRTSLGITCRNGVQRCRAGLIKLEVGVLRPIRSWIP